MIRIVFLGTPEAAVPTLGELAKRYEVGLVVTQPDRPRGRSGKPKPSPVKQYAVEQELPVAQPGSKNELAAAIAAHGSFDLGVVVAYGQILTTDVLALPGAGFLNVHFSLLPRWRGAAPVARALMEGDTMSGVTIIKLDEGLDTGPVLTAQAVDVEPGESSGGLTSRLAHIGSRLLTDSIPGYLSGTVAPVEQSDEGLTYASKLSAQDRRLDPDDTVERFVNKVRGLAPTPGATLLIGDEPHRVLAASPHEHAPTAGEWESVNGALVAAVGGGGVELVIIQPPGKKPMDGSAWLRGRRVTSGAVS